MNKQFIVVLALTLLHLSSFGQHDIKGKIIGEDNIPLAGAYVRWIDNNSGVYADTAGIFQIMHHGESPQLEVSYLGYATDTFTITQMKEFITIRLIPSLSLGSVEVSARRISYGLSSKDVSFTLNLDEREFQKAACCNLSESFENAPAIDVSTADAVTGTKQIKMLGLDGFYTMISKEYMPAIRGLNSYYGMSHIPAAWVKSIQITKGAGSIVNGYESIAGQINVEMKNPFDADKFLLDQFVSQAGRSETDIMRRWDINKYVSTSGFAHIKLQPAMLDNNKDGFVDMPAGEAVSLMNRWKFYSDAGLRAQVNLTYSDDTKRSGQRDYFVQEDRNLYGVNIRDRQWDATAKLGKVFDERPYQSFGSQYQVSGNQHVSTYGSGSQRRRYEAASQTYYTNFLFESILGTTIHGYKIGASFLGDVLDEQVDSMNFYREEWVPGAFIEYTYKPSDTFSIVAGIRTDYNSIYGLSLTPRLHGKYRFNNEKTAIRASVGLGRRTSNIIAQNQYLLASQRTIEIAESSDGAYGLAQESAFNTGISLEHNFRLSYFPASLIIDYFHTSFFNEVVVDREQDGMVRFYNMENGTRSNSVQAQLDLNPLRRTEIRLAYRMFDVMSKYLDPLTGNAVSLEKPLISRHRAFVNLTQKTRSKWQLSTTLHWSGAQQLPGRFDPTRALSPVSEDFFQLNAQISKQLKKVPIELYVGAENILNYRQPNPIVSADQPFADSFDAGMVWGPIFGRMIYGGLRWRIKSSYNEQLKSHIK